MPIYTHECEKCQKVLETIVPMSQSDSPPEELGDDKCPEHKWQKIIKHAPSKKYGDNWGGGKGNWGRDGW